MPKLNVANRTLFHGDNLAFLRGINSGTIHLIATDPPFSKGWDFLATLDSLAACTKFEDPFCLGLDQETPRSDGVLNDISNRLLLRGPCNRSKSNRQTLSGLRRENSKWGRMAMRSEA